MSKSADVKKLLGECRVCSKHLALICERQSARSQLFKTALCCDEHRLLHIRLARVFSTIVDPSYKFDSPNYEEDKNIKLYCFVCEKKYVYCDKKHTLNLNDKLMSVNMCHKCNRAWCYTYTKCNIDSLDSVMPSQIICRIMIKVPLK